MTYKEIITNECTEYAKDPMVRFIGYNTAKGSRMYGTLAGVPVEQCIESPVAENLMMGLAMGMSLVGFKPVVCFERHDFLLLGLDALVNHVDKLPYMSGDQFKFPIVVRAIVGGSNPIDPGPQHTKDYSRELKTMLVNTPVVLDGIASAFDLVGKTDSGAVVSVEYRDLYDSVLT